MSDLAPDIAHHAALDARMVQAARGIKLLTLASWPAGVAVQFLADYARGTATLPQIVYPRQDFTQARRELAGIADEADAQHPLGQYLIESARSWSIAAELAEALGSPVVAGHSIRLYGKPDEPLFETGALLPARWLPPWIERANGLAGMLAFSLFANRIRLEAIADTDGFLDI